MKKILKDCKKGGLIGCRNRDRAKFMGFSMLILLIVSALCYLTGDLAGMFAGGSINVAMALGTVIADCSARNARTGRDNCPKKEDGTAGLIITKLSATYSTDPDTFKDEIQAHIISNGVDKMWPIMNIINNEGSGGDSKTSDVGFSGPKPVGINPRGVKYRIDAGDCLYKELMELDKLQVRVFRVDQEGYIYGTAIIRKSGGSDAEMFRGFDATIKITRIEGNGNDPYALYIDVYYSANYEKELKTLHGFELDELPEGIVGVKLAKGSDSGKALVVSACSGTDYTSIFGEQWAATMFLNDGGQQPTSVTYDAETNELTFTPTANYRVRNALALDEGGIFGLDGVDEFTSI
ncbi:hypothetical protein M2459_001349 [Parabacteroides sp. PF5-5]|uniref:hypothetical protein n=1 Tax=unclassified Parabacteroides TaxID=2649774 RepID=UPI0024760FA5|nr:MULTISPECIES: hypothetical protein [unclassified Parabacteroides]MDH6304614.1 hypothetical protein [Parabacteroides sp. PH5-39]MDH6315773.1 hypothetical protein [Parabacteroides sp. PF5-13]MDH6319432.1 hypothetical protein [Parabacteroides sp. PH5-13]MDH6323163.1 hypothetical protein [Parabacteroides sp. PH5-8]MDH6326965.1 hypothetical protein [Parabacteroides sp. PH5-41]